MQRYARGTESGGGKSALGRIRGNPRIMYQRGRSSALAQEDWTFQRRSLQPLPPCLLIAPGKEAEPGAIQLTEN
jgi:hypothetical protein